MSKYALSSAMSVLETAIELNDYAKINEFVPSAYLMNSYTKTNNETFLESKILVAAHIEHDHKEDGTKARMKLEKILEKHKQSEDKSSVKALGDRYDHINSSLKLMVEDGAPITTFDYYSGLIAASKIRTQPEFCGQLN